MNGCCDVPACTEPSFMGWRPLSESRGRLICENHWTRHKDPADPFDLFKVFGMSRPAEMRRPLTGKTRPERESLPQARAERHEAETPGPDRTRPENRTSGCRTCGGEREAGHTYCERCSSERRRAENKDRQRRFREKHAQGQAVTLLCAGPGVFVGRTPAGS